MSSSQITKRVGAAVKQLRQGLGLTQEQLAKQAVLHRTHIAGIERGGRNVTVKSLEKVARALRVSVACLFPETDEPLCGIQAAEAVDILMVEDNRSDAGLALRAFRQAKITNPVRVVYDGAEALDFLFCTGQYARRKPVQPQLVLLDLNLPTISGLEILHRIKSDQRTRMIPVVVLTSSQKDQDITECRRLGAEAYIVKPVNFQRLCEMTPRLSMCWTLSKSDGPVPTRIDA